MLVFAILQGSAGGVTLGWALRAYYGAPVSIGMFVGLVIAILLLYCAREPVSEGAGSNALA